MWSNSDEQQFKKQLGFEAEGHKKLAFFYDQLKQEAKVNFTVEAIAFHKSKEYARLQRKGVDTILHLENDKKLYVQEKHIRNKDTVYIEYQKPNGQPSWALDETELAHGLVFHFVNHGKALAMDFKKFVDFVKEKLPVWKWQYRENIAVHSGYTGIKIPASELLCHKERLDLKPYFVDFCKELDYLFNGFNSL